MLLSHRKRFIYLKTVKAASTSVEAFFEPYCLPAGEWKLEKFRPESVTSSGIVGYRGLNNKRWFGLRNRRWFDHMSASQVKRQLPLEVWDGYFKFCVIRNPFDKVISAFHFFQWMEQRGFHKMPVAKNENEINRFRNWVKVAVGEQGQVLDRQCYTLNEELCVDFSIRFENLEDDIREVCRQLEISPNFENLPNLVSGVRPAGVPIAKYYDSSTRRVVERAFEFEIERFNYRFPDE